MKAEIINGDGNRMPANKTKVGDLMVVVDKGVDITGDILLHAYEHIVNLNSPSSTWSGTSERGPSFMVEILPPGTKIVLTVE